MAWASLAMAAVSAVSSIQKGRAAAAQAEGQARALEVKADWTRFESRQKSLEYKKRAADELEATLIYQSRINAAAGAGLMDPFSGNPMGLKIQALDVGATNFAMAETNATIVRKQGLAQAEMELNQARQVRKAGQSARRSGYFGALMALGQGAMSYHQTAIPSTSTPPTSSFQPVISPMYPTSYPGYK